MTTDAGQAIFAGALGGVVRWVTLRDNWRDGVAGIFVGAVCSYYLSPLALPLLESSVGGISQEQGTIGLKGFIIGVGGISVSALIVEIFRKRVRKEKKDEQDDNEGRGDE